MDRCIDPPAPLRPAAASNPPPAAARLTLPLAYLAVSSGCAATMQTPERLKAAGNTAFSSGHYAAACEHYSAAIALLDQHPSPGRELGVLYSNRWVLCVPLSLLDESLLLLASCVP